MAHLLFSPPSYNLKERTFKTVDFYRKHQDMLTPASMAFFQSQWDESVTATFHTLLSKIPGLSQIHLQGDKPG